MIQESCTATYLASHRFLYRPYARVDRAKLKRRLLEKCKRQGQAWMTFHKAVDPLLLVSDLETSFQLLMCTCKASH